MTQIDKILKGAIVASNLCSFELLLIYQITYLSVYLFVSVSVHRFNNCCPTEHAPKLNSESVRIVFPTREEKIRGLIPTPTTCSFPPSGLNICRYTRVENIGGG